MSMKIGHRASVLFLIAVIPISIGLYYIFDNFLLSTGQEIVKAWYYGEVVNLQEGQILSAIAKNQNMLEESPFIRSVSVVSSQNPERNLFSIGERTSQPAKSDLEITSRSKDVVQHLRTGFLSFRLITKLPDPNGLFIIYDISSTLLTYSFFVAVALSIAFASYLMWLTMRIKDSERQKRDAIRTDLLKRLAHDVNSPLLAIANISMQVKKLDPKLHLRLEQTADSIRRLFAQTDKVDKKLLTSSEGIAAAIDDETEQVPIASVLKEFILVKRGEYSADPNLKLELKIEENTLDTFASLNLGDFKRHLDNILKNSIEAMSRSVKKDLSVSIAMAQGLIEIKISDTGCGIPPNIIKHIGTKGMTLGKENGKGLGLHFAFASVKHWGGAILIESNINLGTELTIRLPAYAPPKWYTGAVSPALGQKIIIVDDDSAVLERWMQKAQFSDHKVVTFNSKATFKNWFLDGGQLEDNLFFIFDYHLDGNNTGLEIIDELGIASESLLATSAYLEKSVIAEAQRLNVSILPKALI